MVPDRRKENAAKVSLAFNVLSTLLKFVGAAFTGSLGLLSEAIHSGTDVISSTIALASVRAAETPPDDEHPYGHGKIESLAGFAESILLFGIAIYVVIEAVNRIRTNETVQQVPIGIALMAASAIGAVLVSRYVKKIGGESHSLALQSNAQHLTVDAVTSFGVLLALVITHFTKKNWVDPVFAMILAVWMSVGAWQLSKTAVQELIDVRLSDEDIQKTKALIVAKPGIISFHRFRSRRVGSVRHVDFHIVVPNDWSLVQAHDVADSLEKQIREELAPANVVIHVDPFDSSRSLTSDAQKT